MKDEGKFRVRMKGSWAWVGGLEKDAENLTVTIVKDDEPPVVFGPRDREFWESQSYWLEIVPEPPPFPPTPWRVGSDDYFVDAEGRSIPKEFRPEVARRVNWHDKAVSALRFISANGGIVSREAADGALALLALIALNGCSPVAPIGAKDGE